MAEFSSKFEFNDEVTVGQDTAIKAVVTGFMFRTTRAPMVEISYFHNGVAQTAMVEEGRLTK